MKKITLIILILLWGSGLNIVSAQRSYEVKKVCYGSGHSAMVVKHDGRYYVLSSKNNIMFTKDILIADIPFIEAGGESEIRFTRSGGGVASNSVDVITPGKFLFINNRWQQFMYSGLPGARSVCRQIANGYLSGKRSPAY